MACAPVQEPVVLEAEPPCTRHEFDRIVAPIVKIARRIVRMNDDEFRPDADAPLEGAGTFEIRDAILASLPAFSYWWQVGAPLTRDVVEFDDAKIASMFLGTHQSRLDTIERLREKDPNDHPDVVAALVTLERDLVHVEDRALLPVEPFRAMVLANHGAKYLEIGNVLGAFWVEMHRLRNVVRMLSKLKRTRSHTLSVDWNVGGWCPTLTFQWGSVGRLRVPLDPKPLPCCASAATIHLTVDRVVGEVPSQIEQVLPADEPANVAPIGTVQKAGPPPAQPPARVASIERQDTMSEQSKIDMAADLDAYKWNITSYRKKDGIVVVKLYHKGNPEPLGVGEAKTNVEAYATARKEARKGAKEESF